MDELERALAAIAEEHFDEALAILRPRAEMGDAEAQFLLGYLFFTDAEIEHDEAAAWVARAAAQRHPEALYYDACFRVPPPDGMLFGPPDDRARWEQTLLAAELGSEEARGALGGAFATADVDPEANFPWPADHAASRRWYALAAEQGNPDAQYALGVRWLRGEGGPADAATGVAWLARAAEQECGVFNDTAAEVLADIYANGRHGVAADPAAAARWQERAAYLAARPARCGCATCRRVKAAARPG
jgi:TPR repeat protein